MIKSEKKKAFTLLEVSTCIIILAIFAISIISTIRPSNIKIDACKKTGLSTLIKISYTTKYILSKHSFDYSMPKLKSYDDSSLVLTSDDRNAYIAELYKNYMGERRDPNLSSDYTNLTLKTAEGTQVSDFTVSTFSNGIYAMNGAYIAFKLNGDCTKTETNLIYDPSVPDIHTATKSCGLIFFDVNGSDKPNFIGVDMYIVSIGKYGLK